MARLLYLKASPRGERSYSCTVAEAFLAAYRGRHPDDEVTVLDLFTMALPAFDGAALNGKYAIMNGKAHTPEEAAAWKQVVAVIDQFKSFDKYVFAIPMWNFGIPYRLKHYLDVILQPGYTFSFTPAEGYKGLVTGKRVLTVYARGGEYEAASPMDFQKKYVDFELGFIGMTDVQSIVVEPCLAGGPDVAAEKKQAAIVKAKALAETF